MTPTLAHQHLAAHPGQPPARIVRYPHPQPPAGAAAARHELADGSAILEMPDGTLTPGIHGERLADATRALHGAGPRELPLAAYCLPGSIPEPTPDGTADWSAPGARADGG